MKGISSCYGDNLVCIDTHATDEWQVGIGALRGADLHVTTNATDSNDRHALAVGTEDFLARMDVIVNLHTGRLYTQHRG